MNPFKVVYKEGIYIILYYKMASIIATQNATRAGGIKRAGGVGLLCGRGAAPQVFRYKLSDEILQLITYFAKMHRYDDRHSYKEAWTEQWLNDHSEIIEREEARLQHLGYKGDVKDKMFKAGRYYFREKKEEDSAINKNVAVDETRNDDDNEKVRRSYVIMHPNVIKVMDAHLLSIMNQANFKPAQAYKQFCEQNMDLLRPEIMRLIQENNLESDKISEKIKKTYKNRYYIISSSSQG